MTHKALSHSTIVASVGNQRKSKITYPQTLKFDEALVATFFEKNGKSNPIVVGDFSIWATSDEKGVIKYVKGDKSFSYSFKISLGTLYFSAPKKPQYDPNIQFRPIEIETFMEEMGLTHWNRVVANGSYIFKDFAVERNIARNTAIVTDGSVWINDGNVGPVRYKKQVGSWSTNCHVVNKANFTIIQVTTNRTDVDEWNVPDSEKEIKRQRLIFCNSNILNHKKLIQEAIALLDK